MPTLDVDAVARLVRTVGREEILARFGALGEADIIPKPSDDDPDDLVTAADRAAEARLLRGLSELLPDVLIVGEEDAAKNPALLSRGYSAPRVLYVDPLDGTKNFAEGLEDFGVMVALVEYAEPVASWIYMPVVDELLVAERGAGVHRNGVRLLAPEGPCSRSGWTGTLHIRHLPERYRDHIPGWYGSIGRHVPPVGSAAIEYRDVALGQKDFTTFYRLLPWDHAPGALVIREAGGDIRYLDGSPYAVNGRDGLLLAVGDRTRWTSLARDVFDATSVGATQLVADAQPDGE
jgi:fructose-1,6-bisphosphatase/inositol monophosphatase family enzyme